MENLVTQKVSRRIQCHVYSLEESSSGSKKGSQRFKNSLERTLPHIRTQEYPFNKLFLFA